MHESIETKIDQYFDWIINQLARGNTIEKIKNGIKFHEFEKVKEWQSKYGFHFHIFPNDHFINGKPHFHLI